MRIYQLIGMVCLGLLANNSFAQAETKTIERKQLIQFSSPCYDTKELFSHLKTEYEEIPYIFATAMDVAESKVSVWVNPSLRTFTLVATVENLSCVIGSGLNFTVVPRNIAKGK